LARGDSQPTLPDLQLAIFVIWMGRKAQSLNWTALKGGHGDQAPLHANQICTRAITEAPSRRFSTSDRSQAPARQVGDRSRPPDLSGSSAQLPPPVGKVRQLTLRPLEMKALCPMRTGAMPRQLLDEGLGGLNKTRRMGCALGGTGSPVPKGAYRPRRAATERGNIDQVG